MDKENVGHIHTEYYPVLKKKGNSVIGDGMDKPGGHYSK
jgi:hypothetical protein